MKAFSINADSRDLSTKPLSRGKGALKEADCFWAMCLRVRIILILALQPDLPTGYPKQLTELG